jgi:hypothetical protein
VWSIRSDAFDSSGPSILYAHNALSLGTALYSSAQNAPRDSAGNAVKFATPTVANGKVYVGTQYEVSVYGVLNGATQAAQPVITPVGQQFHPSLQLTITDSTPNAQIFYTTDGSIPSTGSTLYTGPFTITSTETVKAIATGTGLIASTVASETYTLVNQVPRRRSIRVLAISLRRYPWLLESLGQALRSTTPQTARRLRLRAMSTAGRYQSIPQSH